MAGDKKSRAELVAENRLLRRFSLWDNLGKIIVQLIRTTGWVICVVGPFWLLHDALLEFAGKITLADVAIALRQELVVGAPQGAQSISVLGNWISLAGVLIGFLFGWLGILYGRQRAKLMREKTEYLQDRIIFLEKLLDPQRSGSDLSRTGETRREET